MGSGMPGIADFGPPPHQTSETKFGFRRRLLELERHLEVKNLAAFCCIFSIAGVMVIVFMRAACEETRKSEKIFFYSGMAVMYVIMFGSVAFIV
jgi:hypothetical protein